MMPPEFSLSNMPMPDDVCMVQVSRVDIDGIMTTCWIVPQSFLLTSEILERQFGSPAMSLVTKDTETMDTAIEKMMSNPTTVAVHHHD